MYVRHCAFIRAGGDMSPSCGCMYVYIIYIYVWPKQPAGNFFIAFSLGGSNIFFSPLSAIKSVITQ